VTVSILWLGRIIPLPFNAGDRIYSAQLVGAVARAGARVVFLGLNNPEEPTDDFNALESRVRWHVVPGPPRSPLLSLLSSLPMVAARFATKQYHETIARELATTAYDAVVFDQYGLGWALDHVQRLVSNRPVMIYLAHDFETEVTATIARNFNGNMVRKLLLGQNAQKTRLVEQRLARGCDMLVALTNRDSKAFSAIKPGLHTVVLPPGYSGPRQSSRSINGSVPRRATIVGSFSWTAKQMNLQRFLEAANLPFKRHAIELQVVGPVPGELKQRLRARFPWVSFRGFVDDLNHELQNARIALVPEETGGGFKLKILDYIFGRVPVAAVESALNGIPDQLKSQFLTAKDLQGLVNRIVEAIDDTDRLNAMQNRAFAIAQDAFDWQTNGTRFVEAVQAEAVSLQRSRHNARYSG
jgi:glycosyltransferase involved in cell wall biosynthesis